MYLYTDLIQPQPHPGGSVPVLRVIAVEHGREEKRYTSIHFQQPYFMSLAKSRIHSIQFTVADSTGKPVGFSHGNSVICLGEKRVFRKIPINRSTHSPSLYLELTRARGTIHLIKWGGEKLSKSVTGTYPSSGRNHFNADTGSVVGVEPF